MNKLIGLAIMGVVPEYKDVSYLAKLGLGTQAGGFSDRYTWNSRHVMALSQRDALDVYRHITRDEDVSIQDQINAEAELLEEAEALALDSTARLMALYEKVSVLQLPTTPHLEKTKA